MIHDELNDTRRDVMTHLVGLQKNRDGRWKVGHNALIDRLWEHFFTVILHLQCGNMQPTESRSVYIEGRHAIHSARSQEVIFPISPCVHALNYNVSYISSRQLFVVGKEFVGDVGRNLLSLQPEPHSASLQNLIGQL